MVSQKKVLTVQDVAEQLKKYPVIGILDMYKLPAKQLHEIRNKLRGQAVIRMVKKRLIGLALKESGLKGTEALVEKLQGEPALLMTDMNPFKLARLISESKSEAPAKEGDIAPRDIIVRAGPTPLPPGPVIGELQKAKIPAMIEGDKIHIREDTTLAEEGQTIDGLLAGVMSKLGITPMEVGLNLLTVWEKGTIYEKEILFISRETYLTELVSAHQNAFNLAFNIGYITSENIPLLLARAHQEAHSLALKAGILTGETVKPLLAKAHSQAESLKAEVGEAKPAPSEEPVKEEPVKEEPAKEKHEESIDEKQKEEPPKEEKKEKEKPKEDKKKKKPKEKPQKKKKSKVESKKGKGKKK
jgi:large subunit ribosomal protein L10